jgi:FAD binding domain
MPDPTILMRRKPDAPSLLNAPSTPSDCPNPAGHGQAARAERTADQLGDLFAAFEPRIVKEPITDFGGIQHGAGRYCALAPTTVEEVREIVHAAYAANVGLRVRGCGHSMNGSSLPRAHELVILTERLAGIRFEAEGTVTAGVGLSVWTVRDLLLPYGCTLPLVNDGYAGPSVGGFVSAGGIGPGSGRYGGFWENVTQITVVLGDGRVQRVRREDPLFPWFFGAMGQLGIIVEVTLDTIPMGGHAGAKYPWGLVLPWHVVREQASRQTSGPPPEECGRRLFWFTLFVPPSRLDEAWRQLDLLESRHAGTFSYRPRYLYPIRFRARAAPLVYPEASSFAATGSWGFLDAGAAGDGLAQIAAFERDFTQLVLTHGFRRYIQSELACGPELYERYFGQKVYRAFRRLKQSHDPGSIINPAWVFLGLRPNCASMSRAPLSRLI